jgi:hypothetical protein
MTVLTLPHRRARVPWRSAMSLIPLCLLSLPAPSIEAPKAAPIREGRS